MQLTNVFTIRSRWNRVRWIEEKVNGKSFDDEHYDENSRTKETHTIHLLAAPNVSHNFLFSLLRIWRAILELHWRRISVQFASATGTKS